MKISTNLANTSPRFLFCTKPKHCVSSFSFSAACGRLVDHSVNCTSPMRLHLLMRGRVWLAESSSLARRAQNSSGRVEKSFAYETIHGCCLSVFPLTFPVDVNMSIHRYVVILCLCPSTLAAAYYPSHIMSLLILPPFISSA